MSIEATEAGATIDVLSHYLERLWFSWEDRLYVFKTLPTRFAPSAPPLDPPLYVIYKIWAADLYDDLKLRAASEKF